MLPRAQLHHIDPSSYDWEKLSDLRSGRQREALAGEWMWIPRPKEQHEIFVSGTLRLEESVTPYTLSLAARLAWRRLRFEVPELVISAGYGTDGKAYVRYVVPKDDDEVDRWVDRTARIEHRQAELGFEELYDRLLQMKGGLDSEQAFLFVHGGVGNGQFEDLKSVDFILNFDHQITDGIGARILTGHFLSLLASALSSPEALNDATNWEESVKNLSKPWIGMMNEEEVLSGPDYEKTLQSNRKFIFNKMVCNRKTTPLHLQC
jgi:hypothetical protein